MAMKIVSYLCLALASGAAAAADLTIGFAQIGSESGWRAAETSVAKEGAKKRGIQLKVVDGQQRQENQIRAVRSFINQGVDAIFLAPVVRTGWDGVLKEARDAKIPVVLLDRTIETSDPGLYLTAVAADRVHESEVAADWLAGAAGERSCNVVELQRTVGSSVAADRKKGFEAALARHPNLRIVRSQTGDFTRAKAKEVMESFIKAEGGGSGICAVYAHNDDMMVGAIQAMREAGLKPGKDILTVSIDAVPDIFKSMVAGEANATVELTPDMAGPAEEAILAYKTKGVLPPKWIKTDSTLYTAKDDPQKIYELKKNLGY
jgi:simple sugar transport system substrate-binding protein